MVNVGFLVYGGSTSIGICGFVGIIVTSNHSWCCPVLYLPDVRVVHQSVETVGKEFYEYLRRRVWVTPMSYLELLGSFKRQLAAKRADVGRNRSRLQVCAAPPCRRFSINGQLKPNPGSRSDPYAAVEYSVKLRGFVHLSVDEMDPKVKRSPAYNLTTLA